MKRQVNGDGWIFPAALVALITLSVTGFVVASKRPPREVADRFWQMEPQYHSECVRRDDKGNCTSTHSWTTMEPHYYAVSRDGARCDVGAYAYASLTRGVVLKCWQLFGWSGGGESDAVVIARMKANPEVRGVSW